MHKFDPRKRSILDDPKRFLFQNPDSILSEIGVKSGQIVADIGCGTGFFSLPLANRVGKSGKVYALDTSRTMIKELRKRSKHLQQMEAVHSRESTFPIEDDTVDLVLLVNMIHEVEDWRRFLKEVHRVLNRSGKICVIDWKKKKMEMGPPLKVRFTKKRLAEMLRQSGYGRIRALSPLPFHNGLIGVKDGDAIGRNI